jgi:hypothetical protein
MESETIQTNQVWVGGIIFLSLGGLIVLINIMSIIYSYILKRFVSPYGFLGGIFLTIGLFLIPVPSLNAVCWIGFIVDHTWGMFIYFLFFTNDGREMLSECWKKKDDEDETH